MHRSLRPEPEMVPIACLLKGVLYVRSPHIRKNNITAHAKIHHLSNVRSQPGRQTFHMDVSTVRDVGSQSRRSSTYSARSGFRPSFFPDEDGTGLDEVPSFDARQSLGDQRQGTPGDGLEDDVAVAGVSDTNVGQCGPLGHVWTSSGSVRVGCCGGAEAKVLLGSFLYGNA
jgi:hypothetical protein